MNKLCKDCVRWYITKADQCEIPNPGFCYPIDYLKAVYNNPKFSNKKSELMRFATVKLKYIHFVGNYKRIYGHPSELNVNNDCLFWLGLPKPLRWFTPIVRFFTNIP